MEQAQAGGRKFARKGPIVKPQKNPSEWRVNVTQLSNPDGSPVDGTVALQLSAAEVQASASAERNTRIRPSAETWPRPSRKAQ